jgi:hypothetical protein
VWGSFHGVICTHHMVHAGKLRKTPSACLKVPEQHHWGCGSAPGTLRATTLDWSHNTQNAHTQQPLAWWLHGTQRQPSYSLLDAMCGHTLLSKGLSPAHAGTAIPCIQSTILLCAHYALQGASNTAQHLLQPLWQARQLLGRVCQQV